MKRCVFMVALVVLLSMAASGQIEALLGLELSDMHLISQESLAHWSAAWTGPIQAATICAWFAAHGYPSLMDDFNGDGMIDELDTIELADQFGRGPMAVDATAGAGDPRLVLGLAEYVAARYPDRFVLKIYDDGFPGEFTGEFGVEFVPDVVLGIELALKTEPSVAALIDELYGGEGVIVGHEKDEGINAYLSGRSFQFEQVGDGLTPLDFASSEEDRWAPGPQGKVLETVGRMADRFLIEIHGAWVPVEFMIALSPVDVPPAGGGEYGCPEDAIAYHETTTTFDGFGSVRVEECVVREGGVDTYIYTVTNLDFLFSGCGLCSFVIPSSGNVPVGHDEAAPWIFSTGFGLWAWWIPLPNCGLLPGETAVFSVSVPAPSVDAWVMGAVGQCVTGVPGALVPRFHVLRTTAPGAPGDTPDEECPDLTIAVRDQVCRQNLMTGRFEMTVYWRVANTGSADVIEAFDVVLTNTTHGGTASSIVLPPLLAGDSVLGSSFLSFEPLPGVPLCPIPYQLLVDSDFEIDECDEDNNTAEGSVCCMEAPVIEPCPDLTISIVDATCEWVIAERRFQLTIEAEVENIGAADVEDPIFVQATTLCGDTSDVIPLGLAAGAAETVVFTVHCSPNFTGCQTVTVEVDHPLLIDECDEENNGDDEVVCCTIK